MEPMKLEESETISRVQTKEGAIVNFAGIVRKLNEDTSIEAEKWFREGRKVSLAVVFWKMFREFVTVYVLKGAWRYGYMGFMSAVNGSLYPLISYTKYWELIEQKRGRM